MSEVQGDAAGLYAQGAPSYFQDSTFAGPTASQDYFRGAGMNYAGSQGVRNMNQGAQGALNNMFQPSYLDFAGGMGTGMGLGGLGAGMQATGNIGNFSNASPELQSLFGGTNPYIDQANQSMATNAIDMFQNQIMPGVRSAQTAYQPGGSSRGDIVTGNATNDLIREITGNANQNYMNAYNTDQGTRLNALGLASGIQGQQAGMYGNLAQAGLGFGAQTGSLGTQRFGAAAGALPGISQNPINMAQAGLGFADQERADVQGALDSDIARFNYEQNAPRYNLEWMNNILQGNAGFGGQDTTQAQRQGLGIGNQIGQGAGAAAALYGAFA